MKKIIGILLFSVVTITSVRSQEPEVRKKQFNIEKSGLAIEGYDPVAYLDDCKRQVVFQLQYESKTNVAQKSACFDRKGRPSVAGCKRTAIMHLLTIK